LGCCPRSHNTFQFVFVCLACVCRAKPCVSRELLLSHHPTEGLPLGFCAASDRHPFVFTRTTEAVVWSHHLVTVAHTRGLGPVHDVVHPPFGYQNGHGLPKRYVDVLSSAC